MIKIKINPYLLCSLSVIMIMSACSKKEINVKNASQVNNGQKSNIPTINLNWLDQFYPWKTTIIPSVFSGSKQIPIELQNIDDLNYENGWQLYANSFSSSELYTQQNSDNKFFALYNVYTGRLRIYYYNDQGAATTSNSVMQLRLNGSLQNSTILNFEEGELIDNSYNSKYVSQIENNVLIANKTWYCAEFELAYDPNTKNYLWSDNSLGFTIYGQNVSSVSLNGTQIGNINGTIAVPKPASSNSWFSGVIGAALKVGMNALGAGAASGVADFLKGSWKNIKISNIKSAAQNSFASGSKDIFSAVMGKKTSTSYDTSKVSLTLNSNITINGSITESPYPVGNIPLNIGGTKNLTTSPSSGFIPYYNQSLGVFNIIGVPKIRSIRSHVFETGDIPRYKYVYNLIIDKSSFNLVFNDYLTQNFATISNIKYDIITTPNNLTSDYKDQTSSISYLYIGNSSSSELSKVYVDEEDNSVFSFLSNSTYPSLDFSFAAIRVSFDVNPNNGTNGYTIIKTFKATVE